MSRFWAWLRWIWTGKTTPTGENREHDPRYDA